MRLFAALSALVTVVAACQSTPQAQPPRPKVRDADLLAWVDAPLIQLEMHPAFSTLPREVRDLSDGSQMWVFNECRSRRTNVVCSSSSTRFGGTTIGGAQCSGGEADTYCCHNQFIVSAGLVRSYRPLGKCHTDCRVRPTADPNCQN